MKTLGRRGTGLFRLICSASLLWALAANAQDELVLVSPHWEGVRLEFGEAFQRRYLADTGRTVDLKWLDVGGASDILKFLRSEFRTKPGGVGIDLFFGGGTDPYDELRKEGLLSPCLLDDATLASLSPTIGGVPLYDPGYHWYAATMAGFGIIYNKVVLRRLGLPEPVTWEDLARPEAMSWVGSADPRKSGSVHMAYEIILQAYGWDRGWAIVTALGANVRSFSSAAAQTPKDVAVGEVAYGLTIDSYAWHQVREAGEEMIGYVMPQDLTVVNGDAIAVLKGAPHRDLAERFVRFVLSPEAQKLWMVRLGEPDGPRKFELGKFSVLPGLYGGDVLDRSPVRMNPFAWHSDFVYDAVRGSQRWAVVNDLIGTYIIEPHADLTRAWSEAREAADPAAAFARLSVPPLSEAEVELLATSGQWRDPGFRNRTLATWGAAARVRYGEESLARKVARSLPAVLVAAAGLWAALYLRRRPGR